MSSQRPGGLRSDVQTRADAVAPAGGGRFGSAERALLALEGKQHLPDIAVRNPRADGTESSRLNAPRQVKRAEDQIQKRQHQRVVLVESLFLGGMVPAMKQRA